MKQDQIGPNSFSSIPQNTGGISYSLCAMSQKWLRIPFPHLSILWTNKVRESASYKSEDIRFRALVEQYQKTHSIKNTESYYYTELQKTIIGELLRIHLGEQGGEFYFSSPYDHLYGKVDAIISLDGINFVGLDIRIVPGRANNTIRAQTQRTSLEAGEFQTTHPQVQKSYMFPIVILRINQNIIGRLTKDFFTTYNNYKDEEIG